MMIEIGSFFRFPYSSSDFSKYVLAIVKMQRVISEHLRKKINKKYALVSRLPFVHKENEITYTDKRYAYKTNNVVRIEFKKDTFIFDGFIKRDDKNCHMIKVTSDIYERANSRSIILGGNSRFEFSYIFREFEVDYINDLIRYQFTYGRGGFIHFNRNGISKIQTKYFEYEDTNAFVNIMTNQKYITELTDTPINLGMLTEKIEIFLNFHSNKKLKEYGMMIDKKKQGIFYKCDESGNFEISNYNNDEPHGFYFDSLTETQGFYERGNKIGFWKEKGKISNHETDRIFFPFPFFIC